MKHLSLVFLVLSLVSTSVFSQAKKSADDHRKALKGKNETETILALQFFGKETKDKTALPDILNLFRESTNSRIETQSATAIGYIAEKGESTDTLLAKIKTTSNTDVVYSCLVAILNIQLKSKMVEPSAKEALDIAEAKHSHDPYIKDFVVRIRKKTESL